MIWSRIHRGELTGLALAREAGFQQAHLSNFLNSRRGLSLDSMDRLLQAMNLGTLDLIDPEELQRRIGHPAPDSSWQRTVGLISAENAASPRFVPEQVLEVVSFKKTFLQGLKPNIVGDRSEWERFVLLKADVASSKAMGPRIGAGALLLIDRHYNSLEPYRRLQHNLYAIRINAGCSIRYAAVAEDRMILRPHRREFPVELLRMERGRNYSDYIVGRVCHMSVEV
jgi:transcriptional regulator with XRE-family HTH domain